MITLAALALAAALSLSACGGDNDSQAASQPAQSSDQSRGSGGRPGGQPGSGKVAAVDGTTAQVQAADSQTAVSWTSSTTFTQEVEGSLSDVTTGVCVVVVGSGSDDVVTASRVQVLQPTDGECAGGLGGGPAGGLPGGGPAGDGAPDGGDRPSDMPTDRPSGGPQAGGFAVGKVTGVSSSGFTVESASRGSDETSTVEVSVESATTFTTSTSASADDVTVGVCVVSRGESDSTGAVTATAIAISQAVDGECTRGGFGRRGGTERDSR